MKPTLIVNALGIPQDVADAILWMAIGAFLLWILTALLRGIYDAGTFTTKQARLHWRCARGDHDIGHSSHDGKPYVFCKRMFCRYREWSEPE